MQYKWLCVFPLFQCLFPAASFEPPSFLFLPFLELYQSLLTTLDIDGVNPPSFFSSHQWLLVWKMNDTGQMWVILNIFNVRVWLYTVLYYGTLIKWSLFMHTMFRWIKYCTSSFKWNRNSLKVGALIALAELPMCFANFLFSAKFLFSFENRISQNFFINSLKGRCFTLVNKNIQH